MRGDTEHEYELSGKERYSAEADQQAGSGSKQQAAVAVAVSR